MSKISIKPDREYLREIVAKINSGVYGIPVFQRNFVWTKDKILELFDSIYRGYPIGSVLLWKPNADLQIPTKDILTEEICETPIPQYYVLDGKQRLTTFCGCVKQSDTKPECFKLYFNLKKETFQYGDIEQPYVLAVSDIYDTFSLIGKLQEMSQKLADDNLTFEYLEKAKNLNAILQGYTIGEMMLDNCSIDEASEVFGRINLQGTKISKASMLQAVNYKRTDSRLLSDEIDEIINSFSDLSFDKLRSDDVFNCFYIFADKMFYDTSLKEARSLDFNVYIDEVRRNVRQVIEFLRKECYIVSDCLLPYSKQLIALSMFFKKHPIPSTKQREELRRWVVYTTYNQSFLNSSLSNVRGIFRSFLSFVDGRSDWAIEYSPVVLDKDFSFRFDLRSARSCFLVMSLIYHYVATDPNSDLYYERGGKLLDSKPASTIVFLSSSDRMLLQNLKVSEADRVTEVLEKFALNKDILDAYDRNDIGELSRLREDLLLRIERRFLRSVLLEIANDES